MVRIVLQTSVSFKERNESLEDLKHKVASYLYCCTDWKYNYFIFDGSLVILTDFGVSKMLDFVSVLRDITNRSDFWFIRQIEYIN